MFDLGRTFMQTVEREPNRLAIVDGSIQMTYSQWAMQIGAIQNLFLEYGLQPGDRIVSILQNRYEAATLHWACQMSGITIVPINWRSKPDEIDYCIQNSGVKLTFVERVSIESFEQSQMSKKIPAIYCNSNDSMIQMPCMSDYLAHPAEAIPKAGAEDFSVMLFTSGTTGKPKGVPRRHRAERAAGIAHVAQNQYANHEVTLGVMPLYHTMGVRTLISLCVVNGTYIALPKWDCLTALKLIQHHRVTHLYLVPTLYHDMVYSEHFSEDAISSVRKLGFAGAPMHDGLLHKLKNTFKPTLFVNHYGSSEIYTYTISQNPVEKPGSAGKAGINARIRIIQFDTVEKKASPMDMAKPGEEGQIICDLSGDEAFEGYWKRPDADEKAIRDGWFCTGDSGYFDEDGDIFVTGRVDDMIISGGENISPVEIESVLSLHPAVDEVAVVGLKDERWGQKVVAFIKQAEFIEPKALDQYCRNSKLVNFKCPREYIFVAEIPKSPVGKILKRKLVSGEYEESIK